MEELQRIVFTWTAITLISATSGMLIIFSVNSKKYLRKYINENWVTEASEYIETSIGKFPELKKLRLRLLLGLLLYLLSGVAIVLVNFGILELLIWGLP